MLPLIVPPLKLKVTLFSRAYRPPPLYCAWFALMSVSSPDIEQSPLIMATPPPLPPCAPLMPVALLEAWLFVILQF